MTQQGSFSFSLRHLVKGSALYGSADIVVAVVRFLLIAVYTRIMTPSEFGLYSLITTSLMLAVVFIPLGIPSAVMLKLRPNSPLESKECKDGAFAFLLHLCIVCGAVFYAVSAFCFPHSLMQHLAPWLIVQNISDVCGQIPKASLRIKERITAFSSAKIVRAILMTAILFVMINFGAKGIYAVIISESMSALAEWLLCMALDQFFPSRPSISCLTSLLSVGAPLTLVALGIFCIDLSDRYVVYGFLGQQAIGFYAAAGKFVVAASFFTEAFNSMWFPYYLNNMRESCSGRIGMDKNIRRFALRLTVLFSVIISLFMLVLPLFVKLHVFGKYFIAPQYHAVSVLVAPLTLAYFFKATFYIASGILIARGNTWKLARAVYVGAFVNIGANVLLVTVFHGMNQFHALTAIALMTSLSYFVSMVVTSQSAGLFLVRFWVTSKTAFLCAAALCIAFVPLPVAVRYFVWALCAVAALILARRDLKNPDNLAI
jgi:O-antigen/teichoic acid export membrane protein